MQLTNAVCKSGETPQVLPVILTNGNSLVTRKAVMSCPICRPVVAAYQQVTDCMVSTKLAGLVLSCGS